MSALPKSRAAFQCRWEPYKETLRRLFLVEKQTLKEVSEFMVESYNFKATESQYEHIFRQWGFAKNLKKSDWMAIEHNISKRKRQGKETEILYNGITVSPKKVRKAISRNQWPYSPTRDGGKSSSTHCSFPSQEITEISVVPSPKLSSGVIIRTPGMSPTIQATVLEWPMTALSTAENNTKFRVIAPDSSRSASTYPSSQVSKYMDPELWTEFCDLRDHNRSSPQGSVIELVEAYPILNISTNFYGLDLGMQDFTLLEGFETFNTSLEIIDPEWSSSHTEALDIFRNTFNTTPIMRQNHFNVSNWGGKHSGALYNIPWFRFQHLATEILYSGNSPKNHDYALNSPLHWIELQIQHSIALEEREHLLSGLFGSAKVPKSLQKLPHLKSLLQDMIPERFESDIENKLQLFFDPSNKSSLFELTEFHLYFLSNNMFTEAQADNLLEFIAKQKYLEHLKSFFQMKTPTIQGGKYLQIALENDKLDIVEYLLDNGVDVNPPLGNSFPYSQPPLHIAVYESYVEVVKRLIGAGADLHGKDYSGDTTLSDAVQCSQEPVECIQLLLEAGANVDNEMIKDLPLLDWVYLNRRHLYGMLHSRSQHAKRSLTISGILCAANAGRRALSQYLNSMPPIEDLKRRNKLEVALCQAAKYPDQPIEVVHNLLEIGVDPNVNTVRGESPPLVLAAMNNDIDLAELLLDAGANINAPNVLLTAAKDDDNHDILSFLIEEGADIKTFGAGALRKARFGNKLAIIKLLLNSGVDINDPASPKGGRTLLQRAAWIGNINAVKYLIGQGADINAPPSHIDGFTALQGAIFQDNAEMVKLLLALGADVNAAPSRSGGKTALEASVDWRVPSERFGLFKLLLDQGAAINRPKVQRRYRNWSSVLTILVNYSASEDFIRSAMSAGADINVLGHGSGARTPVQAAAEVGSTNIVRLLLDNGANINAPPSKEYGRTALQGACSTVAPNIELVRLLLDNGADVNAPAGFKQGLTAFQGAAIRGHIKIVLMLLDAGAEVNAEPASNDGRTALDGAAENGRLDMVQLLLNLGAKSEEPGATGFDKAIKLAKKYNYWAITDLLEDQSQKA